MAFSNVLKLQSSKLFPRHHSLRNMKPNRMAIIYVAGRSNYLNLFMTNIKFAPHGISSRRFLRSLSLYEIYNFQSFY